MYDITGQPESSGPLDCKSFVGRLIHPDDVQTMISRYEERIKLGGDFHAAFRIVRLDDRETHMVEMHGRFKRESDGSIQTFTGTLSGINGRALAAEFLQDANRRKDALLATLAQKLRNPSAPIRNVARVLHQHKIVSVAKVEWAHVNIESSAASSRVNRRSVGCLADQEWHSHCMSALCGSVPATYSVCRCGRVD